MKQPIINIASSAAQKAGDFIKRAIEHIDDIPIETKGVNDFVTQVDRNAEQIIIDIIQKAYPDHTILAEESGLIEGRGVGANTTWIIDPLDGTTNFIHGYPHFAVSIGVEVKGRLEHGLVYDPVRDEEFSASRGYGARLNGRRLRISKRTSLDGALIATGLPFKPEQMTYAEPYMKMLAAVMEKTAGIRRPGAASLDLAYVAAGRCDGYWEFGLQKWDIAAGALIVQEAGGLVCDFAGGENYLDSGNIICGNPKVLKNLMRTLAPFVPKELRK